MIVNQSLAAGRPSMVSLSVFLGLSKTIRHLVGQLVTNSDRSFDSLVVGEEIGELVSLLDSIR